MWNRSAVMSRLDAIETLIATNQEILMATLKDVQASQAAEDAEIKTLISDYQTTQASVTALQATIAGLQAAGGASPADLDSLKADADATTAQISAALAPVGSTPAAPAPAAPLATGPVPNPTA